jgi:hypothetical protein
MALDSPIPLPVSPSPKRQSTKRETAVGHGVIFACMPRSIAARRVGDGTLYSYCVVGGVVGTVPLLCCWGIFSPVPLHRRGAHL